MLSFTTNRQRPHNCDIIERIKKRLSIKKETLDEAEKEAMYKLRQIHSRNAAFTNTR